MLSGASSGHVNASFDPSGTGREGGQERMSSRQGLALSPRQDSISVTGM